MKTAMLLFLMFLMLLSGASASDDTKGNHLRWGMVVVFVSSLAAAMYLLVNYW